METQLFFCEFKSYIATAFEIEQSNLDCLFDIYEAYLDSNSSIFHFVNSNFNNINVRVNSILCKQGKTNMNTSNFNTITFGLNVVTKYSNGKITATMKHGNDTKTSVKMSYDHSLNTGENHYKACLLCLEKIIKQDEKEFTVLCYSYNEKDNGYSFTCKRTV